MAEVDATTPTPPGAGALLFSDRDRRMALAYVAVIAGVATAGGLLLDGRDGYLLGWVLAAGPSTTPALWLTARAARDAAPEYVPFWRRWLAGLALFYAAGVTILGHLLTGSDVVGMVASAIGLVALALWGWAALEMLRSISGLRSTAVDVIEALMAIVVVSAPAVYFTLQPVLDSGETWLAVTFAVVAAVQAPTGIYLSVVNYLRLPPGGRSTQGLALLLASVSAVNLSLQVWQVLDDFSLPFPPLLALQAANMGLLLLLPLYAHADAPAGLERLSAARQVRHRSPMPILALVVLPPLAAVAVARADAVAWGPPFVLGVFVALLVLAVALGELGGRETRRLYAELEREAEQRRALLRRMVAALEEDRHHVAAELHTQAVESFAALGALVQTAYATLPPDTAATVKQSMAAIQDDLSARVESLRRLMVAVRPPALAERGLGPALEACADEVGGAVPRLRIEVRVDADLHLDWATSTIAYRLAQLALDNVRDHARASACRVSVHAEGDAVVVEVADDGAGFDPASTPPGGGLEAMRLFAGLGRGTFDVRSSSGAGTTVRVVLGVVEDELLRQVAGGPPRRLRVVTGGAIDGDGDGDGDGHEAAGLLDAGAPAPGAEAVDGDGADDATNPLGRLYPAGRSRTPDDASPPRR